MAQEKLDDMSDLLARVGERLRFLRNERRLSIQQLADLARCSAESIEQFELGRLDITATTLHELARALQVEPSDILNHDPDTNDFGWLAEAMRTDPKMLRLVKAKLAARLN
jgi:XRE family transcriptional regulator, regulator of sulfur utilization